ncbi:MAG: MBL fold metallo-hydrolase [Methanothrix sp.]|nr:MBL fold metallo-hydrolase [Methanothrix sp.]
MISQRVPGTGNVTVYPYLCKIDIMSSNSYLFSSPGQIALIDPGGVQSQAECLEEMVQILQDELPRPVVVYLTHVHIDHWYQLKQCKTLSKAFLAVQETGARALETNDPQMTLSLLLDRPMSAVPVDIRLLSCHDKTKLGETSLNKNGWSFDYVTNSRWIAEDAVLYSQIVPLGKEDCLEIYHTPGHSPDGVCIRTGSMLIVGDVFFAPNPGVAGAYGWSQKDFMQSILKILWILENEKILICGCGHGKFIDAQTAHKTLQVMYSDAASLKDLQEITPHWARRTSDYAQDLISELERIFTIIAGRLAYISHVLGELEEEAQAKELDCLLDTAHMDELFVDFHAFARELHAGKKLDIEMVHKTGQVVGRLDKLFAKRKLESVLGQSLLERAGRLLSDYAATYRGFRPPYIVSRVDINRLIEVVLEKLLHHSYEEEAIMQAESVEDFRLALMARIAHVNIFEYVDLAFWPGSGKPFARMDQERFADILIDMLERFAGARMKKIEIATALKDEWLTVRITGRGECTCHPLSQSKRFFERSLALSGGLLQTSFEANSPCVEIEFSTLQDEV